MDEVALFASESTSWFVCFQINIFLYLPFRGGIKKTYISQNVLQGKYPF